MACPNIGQQNAHFLYGHLHVSTFMSFHYVPGERVVKSLAWMLVKRHNKRTFKILPEHL